MCGRYYPRSDKQKIAEAFHVRHVEDFPLPPWDYNIAPSTMQSILRANRDTGERELVQSRWGLVPFVTKTQPFKKRRCLVPASGFYEWTHDDPKNKRPFACDLGDGQMMALAGLWDAWKDPANGRWLQSYTIITADANELMMPIHNRMPVILH